MTSKKVTFVNVQKKDKEPSPPVALPRSNSMTGLNTLSKSIVEHEIHLEQLNVLMSNFHEIIKKYEIEILQLQDNINSQNKIIENQVLIMNDYKLSLDVAQKDLQNCKNEIANIWNS